jgi:GrpB-like predicted nucleotidyltransferase (UPF0157 family)
MITIVPYDPVWPAMFSAEAARILHELGEFSLRIEHVGSTSVPGMAAKPVVDIQVSVATLTPRRIYLESLAHVGYSHVDVGQFDLVYPFFQKPAEWPCTYHTHLCVADSEQERMHLAFRDYLRDHSRVAAEYVRLKHRLAAEHDDTNHASRERYSLSKTEFIHSVLKNAFAEGYPSPYPITPNQSSEPTLASGTSPAGQEPRLP